jgi:hypothetical protein
MVVMDSNGDPICGPAGPGDDHTGRCASRLCATSWNAISPPLMRIVADGALPAISVATQDSQGDSAPQDEPGTSTKCE